ncbi:MAG TPA: acetate--CoA ligase family protein, partial [Thermoanaerobaculia bacterium]|nr:acetate--CoA ligase family protein [Thermoanaerobaculia bacterium]
MTSVPSPGQIFAAARAAGRTALLEPEVYGLLAGAGFDVPRHVFWEGAPGDRLPGEARSFLGSLRGAACVLKIVSPDLLHKTDVGGVAFAPAEEVAVREAAKAIWEAVGRRAPSAARLGILLLERLAPLGGTPAAETLVSVKQDAAFGPVIVLGLGGVLTEWFGTVSGGRSTAIVSPGRVREGLAAAAAASPALDLLFSASRRHPVAPLDLDGVARKLEALGRLATSFAPDATGDVTLEEVEVNPLLLLPDGRWVAADGKARLSDRRVTRPSRPIRKIRNLLEPESAAVFGASTTTMNPGRIILRNLKASEGLRYGKLWAVHPKAPAVDGVPCVTSGRDLPEAVDLAVIAIPADGARDSVRDLCATGKAASVILIPGGFAETGQRALDEEIRRALVESRSREDGGPVLVGGNCLGIVSKHRYNTFFVPYYKLPFHDAPGDRLVAISQSGAYLVSLTSNLDGIVFPKASISFGNQMDLTVSDFLEYFERDDSVSILACYIEGFQPLDGERFVRIARRLRQGGKRIIAFKGGKTPLGAKAAQSHTAALAGDYAVARALMEQAGVVVTETLDMFEDYVKIFTMLDGRAVSGRRVAVLSNAGFECASVLDQLFGLTAAALSAETKRRLAAGLPSVAHADNPVDATPMAATHAFVEAAEALLDDPGVDALIVSPVPVTPALDNLAPDLVGTHTENIHAPGSLPQELLRMF